MDGIIEPAIFEQEEHRIRRTDYVEIVNTNDEWEGLIGVVEDFLDDNGKSCQAHRNGATCLVRIPLSRRSQKGLRLYGVNHFTDYVRQELKIHDELHLLARQQLEWFDPDDL